MLEGYSDLIKMLSIDTIDSFDFSQCCEQLIPKTPEVKQSAVEISRMFNF